MNEMETRALVTERAAKCFLCRWILEDLDRNGKLTSWPIDFLDVSVFSAAAKRRHLELELVSLDNRFGTG